MHSIYGSQVDSDYEQCHGTVTSLPSINVKTHPSCVQSGPWQPMGCLSFVLVSTPIQSKRDSRRNTFMGRAKAEGWMVVTSTEGACWWGEVREVMRCPCMLKPPFAIQWNCCRPRMRISSSTYFFFHPKILWTCRPRTIRVAGYHSCVCIAFSRHTGKRYLLTVHFAYFVLTTRTLVGTNVFHHHRISVRDTIPLIHSWLRSHIIVETNKGHNYAGGPDNKLERLSGANELCSV